MKKLYFSLLTFLFLVVAHAQIVNIPDPVFKAKLLAASPNNNIASTETPVYDSSSNSWFVFSHNEIDTNNDGEIQVSEALTIKMLNLYYSGITNLEGIESFTNIIALNCYGNQLTSLNVQGLTNLQYLNCSNNQLPSLNVQGLTNLQDLYCQDNQLTSLNVQGLSNFRYLKCSSNQLPSLNLQGLTNLKSLSCNNNQLSSLNVHELEKLQVLGCAYNQLTTLFIKNNNVTWGTNLNFSNNPNLAFICADEADLPYVQQKVNQLGYASTCQVNSYCNFVPGGVFYTIQGNNNLDLNNNGCDVSD